ncbi:MAG: Unknown protein, partial [uncultured Aureispira sp.]
FKSELNKVCPEGWHNATTSEWERLFEEVIAEFPSDEHEEDNKIMKEERRLRYLDEEEPMISFDVYLISSYPIKWYLSEPNANRIKKKGIYSNFYGLNIQLYPSKFRFSRFGAYDTDGKFVVMYYVGYTQSVKECYLTKRGSKFFSVRCVEG